MEEFERHVPLLVVVVVGASLVVMALGQFIAGLVFVGVIGFYLMARAQVRATEIQAAAIIKAAEIAAEAEKAKQTRRPTTP